MNIARVFGSRTRSQGLRTTRGLMDKSQCRFHLISCAVISLKTSVPLSLAAETYQTELGAETADHIRAAVTEIIVLVSRRGWTTWNGLVRTAMGTTIDKRLGIMITSLRHAVRKRQRETIAAPMLADELPDIDVATAFCRWVDTDCTLADALTKQMPPEKVLSRILVV